MDVWWWWVGTQTKCEDGFLRDGQVGRASTHDAKVADSLKSMGIRWEYVLAQPLTHSLACLLTCSHAYLPTHSPATHSRTHPLTRSMYLRLGVANANDSGHVVIC